MNNKTPAQVIDEALARMNVAQVFQDEKAAMSWVKSAAMGLMRYKLQLNKLPEEERDAMDPIEAGYIHAKDLGTRSRRQRVGWIDDLLDKVATACFCEWVPLSGTMSSWLIGRKTDRQIAKSLLGSLVPTAEKLGQDAYLKEYHAARKAGNVEAARGNKDQWHERFAGEFYDQFEAAARDLEVEERELQSVLQQSNVDLAEYMNTNFLPMRGNRTERLSATNGKPTRRKSN